MKALDLFCGAGGAAMGLNQAGFEVIGVDIKPQPRFPFAFVQADALELPFDLDAFDLIWASPVCKRYTRLWRGRDERRDQYPDQIEPVRRMLKASGKPYVIENVPGAPLRADVVLSGAQFDLPIIRKRVFEVEGFQVPFSLSCQHSGTVSRGDLACVAGKGVNNAYNHSRDTNGRRKWRNLSPALKAKLCKRNCAKGWREAMQIPWMTRDELAQAIPPAYSHHIASAWCNP